jgi:hypothetical protein
VRLGLNFNATRARENTFSLSKRFPFSTSEYWNPRKHSAAVTHGTLMNAISFHDASGRCASAYPTQFFLLYPTCTSTFHAKSIDADPSAEDGTIFFFFPFTSLPQTYTLQAFKQCIFPHLFLCCPARSETADGRGLPLPASFYYSKISRWLLD